VLGIVSAIFGLADLIDLGWSLLVTAAAIALTFVVAAGSSGGARAWRASWSACSRRSTSRRYGCGGSFAEDPRNTSPAIAPTPRSPEPPPSPPQEPIEGPPREP